MGLSGTLYWDVLHLWRNILEGIAVAGQAGDRLDSVGIDSWAVDYGLLDDKGRLIANPVHHRDARTTAVIEDVHRLVSPEALYRRSGIAFNRSTRCTSWSRMRARASSAAPLRSCWCLTCSSTSSRAALGPN